MKIWGGNARGSTVDGHRKGSAVWSTSSKPATERTPAAGGGYALCWTRSRARWPNRGRLGPGGEQHAGRIRDFNVDCERRDARAAIHPNLDVLAFNGDVLGDRG